MMMRHKTVLVICLFWLSACSSSSDSSADAASASDTPSDADDLEAPLEEGNEFDIPEGYEPSTEGLIIQLDAANIEANAGDAVSVWPDESGTGNDLVHDGEGAVPSYNETQSIEFGSDFGYSLATQNNLGFSGSPDFTVLIVAFLPSNGVRETGYFDSPQFPVIERQSGAAIWDLGNLRNSEQGISLHLQSVFTLENGQEVRDRRLAIASKQSVAYSDDGVFESIRTSQNIYSLRHSSGGQLLEAAAFYVNSQKQPLNSDASRVIELESGPFVLAGYRDKDHTGGESNVRIYDVLVYDRALSDEELRNAECYLAGKNNMNLNALAESLGATIAPCQ